MSKLVFVVPWAICDTENIYIKKLEQETQTQWKPMDVFEDWTIEKIIDNPDRRSKDKYVILDVYKGCSVKEKKKEVQIITLTNSKTRLKELDYRRADDMEKAFIRQRILKWDKPEKKRK